MSEDDFLWPPESFEANDDPALASKLQHTVDIIFAQLRRLQSSAAAGHDILSETHEDTTVAAAVNGDLVRRAAGAWARLPIGAAGQALVDVAGLPEWSNDGTALTIDPTKGPHALLSATHSDTVAASPVLGDMVVAQGISPADLDVYWLDGLPLDGIADILDVGGEDYWIDGLPASGLESANAVAWARKPNSTTAGYVWTAGATGPDWQPSANAGFGVGAYRSGDFSIAAGVVTTVVLQAVSFDSGGFWSSGSRLTVPASGGGVYVIVAQAKIDATIGGILSVVITVNGVERARAGSQLAVGPAVTPGYNAACILSLAAGDYVEMAVDLEPPSGSTQLIFGGAAKTFLHMARV